MYDVRVIAAEVAFDEQSLVKPLILSTGAIDQLTQATATVHIRSADGSTEAVGNGSIYLSDLWAWPDPRWSHEQRDRMLRDLATHIALHIDAMTGHDSAHPLELGLRLHHGVNHLSDPRFADIPVLARAMCMSPFDAALHDAAGRLHDRSAFALYDRPVAIPSADRYFQRGVARAIAATLRSSPLQTLPAWLIVGKNDNLDHDIRPWVCDRGYRCFKLKVMGRDNAEDVARTIEVFNAVRGLGARNPRLSIDSNEANPDARSVADFLHRLREQCREAFDALEYLEQPTGRDILQARYDWREVAAMKPVMLDEGLTDAELLDEAHSQSWSGFALKSCKGHSFTLMAAAWARQHEMLISLQDLTNPGLALIHAALLGAYLPTINGVELNSPQFTPSANHPWLQHHSSLFDPIRGVHCLAAGKEKGLGSIPF